MSSEVVKKRGRPKKVISDSVEVDVLEIVKTTTRAKSTKTALKKEKPATPAKSTASAKSSVDAKRSIPSPIKPTIPPKPASTPLSTAAKAVQSPRATAKTTTKSPITPETSKILSQVRELPTETNPASKTSSKPSPSTATSNSSSPSSQPLSTPPQTSKPMLSTPKSTIPSEVKTSLPTSSKPHIPIAALNSEVVSNISARAGARPNPHGTRALPKGYNKVATKVIMAMCAAPVAIVTSYVLYQRLVLGEEKKILVKPGLASLDTPHESKTGGAVGTSS